jgi:hypothetical protein
MQILAVTDQFGTFGGGAGREGGSGDTKYKYKRYADTRCKLASQDEYFVQSFTM